jgi:DNA replication protein DnaC
VTVETHECPKCGGPVRTELPDELPPERQDGIGERARELVLKMARLRRCTACEDAERAQELAHARKLRQADMRRRVERSLLPKGLQALSWDDMLQEGGRREVIAAVRAWVKDGGSLFLYGRPGPGKTRLAATGCWQLLEDGRTPRFVSASVLFTKANASYGTEWREQAEEILLTAGPLILDDLGKEKPTALARQLLQSAIEDRIENQVHLLITSNHQANELGAIYGDWLASRLGAMPQWNMPGPDLRLEV